MTLYVEKETDHKLPFHYRELASKVIAAVLEQERFPYPAEVSLTLVDDEAIRLINCDTRGIDAPTDVLSFPMFDYEQPACYEPILEEMQASANPETGEVLVGDIVLSLEKVAAQAKEYGHSEKREYAFLICHSMLHLVGYDHMEENERGVMEARQKLAMEKLGIHR